MILKEKFKHDVKTTKEIHIILSGTWTHGFVEWCNLQGRKMGINGNTNHGIPKAHDDDLDAFRHTFANALAVVYSPFHKGIITALGYINEALNPGHPCSREMDIYNNKVGRDLAPSLSQVIKWREADKDPIEEIAKIVAQTVKSGKTINDLGDDRLSESCQAKYGKKKAKKTGQYIWRTQGDKKVRTEHYLREGKVFD